jgi:methyltransferase-like protein/SAM-dependent methyltransferase
MKTAGGTPNPYDKVLYPAATFPQSHPNRLATVAFLRGMQPAAIDHCRVLELGCGLGSNLIGMAFHLPESQFVGLDLAGRPIAAGQSFAGELGLANVALHEMDISAASSDQFGRFDFIIAHGLYSWVPEPVRGHILSICRQMLTPQGVAYVSYNAYPGNHLRDLIRGMIRYHTAGFEDPIEKVGQARGLLKFLAESTPKQDYYVTAIRSQFDRTLKYMDEAFFHDDLSEINQPFYFHEFISDAQRYGLQFLGEARPNDLQPDKFTPAVTQKMKELEGAPEVVREQYKDFIRGSAFRETLLCHREVEISSDLLIERIPQLYASCDAAPKVNGNEDQGSQTIVFRRPGGAELETAHPLISAAIKILGAHWPAAVSFQDLLTSVHLVAPIEAGDEETLAETLARAYQAGFLDLQIFPNAVTNMVSERPAISRLARFQLERGQSPTNQLHVTMRFPDPLSRRMVQLLDGSRDQEMVRRDLLEFVRAGHGELLENGVPVTDLAEVEEILRRRVDEGLRSLAREAMLDA